MSKRKINTKQLTRIKVTTAHGNKRFYFRYYCPDLQKDNRLAKLNGMLDELRRRKNLLSES